MLKGSREAVIRRIQPVSIHGQLLMDIAFADPADPDGQLSVARLGPEAIPRDLQPGDVVRVDFLVGVATAITKVE
jgi:hypothetical protein